MKKTILILLLYTFFLTPARAVLIETDLYSEGDGLLTYDSVTGLEWMDMTETYWLFGHQVIANLSEGGIWEDFFHASISDVSEFYTNAGIPVLGGVTQSNYESVKQLIELMGGIDTIRGLTSSQTGLGLLGTRLFVECYYSLFDQKDICLGTASLNQYYNNNYYNTASSDGGSWLARVATNPPTIVPLPASFWLFISGIMSLWIARRKK